jgi:acetyl esterase
MLMRARHDSSEPLIPGLYRKAGSLLVEGMFEGLSRTGRLHPASRLNRHGVERLSDIPYLAGGREAHLLDVYRPMERTGPLPVCLYVHGGGFRILSKDTHWLMGLLFARRGYLVFNINYRLAPGHPFPAAIQDTCAAFSWVMENARDYGGDPSRCVLAGESAGANLVTSLTLAACYRRKEPYAARVWDLNRVPRAVVPACGIYQVSDVDRFHRNKRLSRFIRDRLEEVSHAYLLGQQRLSPEERELADPLLVLESGRKPDRGLPPFFLPVGTRDLLQDDTRRLHDALWRLGADCDARYYAGEAHAFHALIWRKNARACWKATFEFLRDRIGEKSLRGTSEPVQGP